MAEQLTAELTEAQADVQAVTAIVKAMESATSPETAIGTALKLVRELFGWAYGSYWQLDGGGKHLRFAQESGSVNEDFRRVTLEAAFAEGVGLSGRAWRSRDLVFVRNIGDVTDCVRAPVAVRAGVRSGVCFPLIEENRVVGTMDFFATETLHPSENRLDALRNVGRMVSAAFERIAKAKTEAEAAADTAAVNKVLAALGSATVTYISSDGATKGVKFPTSVAGEIRFVINTSGTAANLFAASGGNSSCLDC